MIASIRKKEGETEQNRERWDHAQCKVQGEPREACIWETVAKACWGSHAVQPPKPSAVTWIFNGQEHGDKLMAFTHKEPMRWPMIWPLRKAGEDFYTPALLQVQVVASHSGEHIIFLLKKNLADPTLIWKTKQRWLHLILPHLQQYPSGFGCWSCSAKTSVTQRCCIRCSLLPRSFFTVNRVVPSKVVPSKHRCCAKRVKGSPRCLCAVWLRKNSWRESADWWESLGECEPSAVRQAHQRLKNDWW